MTVLIHHIICVIKKTFNFWPYKYNYNTYLIKKLNEGTFDWIVGMIKAN